MATPFDSFPPLLLTEAERLEYSSRRYSNAMLCVTRLSTGKVIVADAGRDALIELTPSNYSEFLSILDTAHAYIEAKSKALSARILQNQRNAVEEKKLTVQMGDIKIEL